VLDVFGEIVPDVGAKTRQSSFSPYRRDGGARDSHPFAPWRGLVVPLEGLDVVAPQCGEGVDVVGAQGGVHILGHELAGPGPVLGPVGVVTYPPQGTLQNIEVVGDVNQPPKRINSGLLID